MLLAGTMPVLVSAGESPDRLNGVQFAQMTVHERIIIRVPRMGPARGRRRAAAVGAAADAVEGKEGPQMHRRRRHRRCARLRPRRGRPGDGRRQAPARAPRRRLRAHGLLQRLYLRPKADGKVCADRDVLRMRSGASCGIARFKTLVAR
ncbi:hypothetical protein MOP88_01795 [Sphingomonas sp. WKB10]|nr:hypothetical protein [Sphingomonas sp. WKB10]